MTRISPSPRGRGGSLAAELKEFARSVGFHLVGITSAAPFPQAELDITRWLAEGHQGEMAWLTDARARLACRPDELLPGARSLVVVGVSYRTQEPDPDDEGGRIARYAWGDDYHEVMKTRLRALGSFLDERVGGNDGPLVERDAAVRAGLGFRGKNTNLLTPIGSFVFLGALLTDVELEFDAPITRDCGSCRLCIDACPTDALDQAYHLAAERCIAYLTIERREEMPEPLRSQIGNHVFGCDVCQEVCPFNNRAPVLHEARGLILLLLLISYKNPCVAPPVRSASYIAWLYWRCCASVTYWIGFSHVPSS